MKIITKQKRIAKAFLNDIAQGDWPIKLDKNDFEEPSNHQKPIIAVKAEDDKSIAELADIAFSEIAKMGCKPARFIAILSFRLDDELMMQEMTGFNECLTTHVDKNTELKWGVQSLADMPCKRRVTMIAFVENQKTQKGMICRIWESFYKKLSRKLTMRNISIMAAKLVLFICLEVICLIGLIYFERNNIYRFGVWWEKIETFLS